MENGEWPEIFEYRSTCFWFVKRCVVYFHYMDHSSQESGKGYRPSWVATLLDVVVRHTREIVGGALAIAGTLEGDVRAFVIRFVRDLVLGFVLLFIGLGFIVFGIGITLVELFRLGSAAGSIVVGVLFVAIGSLVFFFSRK